MSSDVQPIQLEIYRNLFFSIAEEMGTVLRRTAYSPNIKERRDYSCALFDGNGQLVAMGDHMPVHLGSMPLSVKAAVDAGPIYPGDIVILNDPFAGGTHLPDITLVAPVYTPSETEPEPLFYVASRAHHSDVGGMTPGSMPISREIYQEGLIIPPLKLYEEGDLNRGLLYLLLHNVRTPLEREGDLAAQVGSLRVGERRLLELVERRGRQELSTYMSALQDHSDRMVRALIKSIPDGRYEGEDFLDDGGLPEAGPSAERGVRIRVTMTVAGDRMSIDFNGTDPQVEGSLNAVRAITLSAVYYVMRCLAPEDVPSTAGLLRPIEVLAPGGCVVNARYPAATAGGNVETSQRIVDVLLKALSQAVPERIPAASSGSMNNLAMGGIRPADGRPFSYYETIGGGMGGSFSTDGDNGVHTHMTNSLNTPIEAFEREFPLRVREYRLRPGSGGKGRHSGGEGIVRSVEALTPTRVTVLSERRRFAPYGLKGGRPGKKGMNLVSTGGRRKRLSGKAQLQLEPGDILTIETPGGGGWGTPDTRRSSVKGREPARRPRSRRDSEPRGRDRAAAASRSDRPDAPEERPRTSAPKPVRKPTADRGKEAPKAAERKSDVEGERESRAAGRKDRDSRKADHRTSKTRPETPAGERPSQERPQKRSAVAPQGGTDRPDKKAGRREKVDASEVKVDVGAPSAAAKPDKKDRPPREPEEAAVGYHDLLPGEERVPRSPQSSARDSQPRSGRGKTADGETPESSRTAEDSDEG